MSDTYDIAVIGAGPAGSNAALAAARHGKSVALLDEQTQPGGQVWRAKDDSILAAPVTPDAEAGDALRLKVAKAAVTHLGDTRVWQIEQHGTSLAAWPRDAAGNRARISEFGPPSPLDTRPGHVTLPP